MGGFLIFWEVGAVTVDFVSDLNLVLKKKKKKIIFSGVHCFFLILSFPIQVSG